MNHRKIIAVLFGMSLALGGVGCSSDSDQSQQQSYGTDSNIQTNVPANRDPGNSMGEGTTLLPLGSNSNGK